ncbi:PglL family O-oligosaccharyltransferase [Halomonas rhizosphaerae]|uniref:Wzy polymerase domain-containing protein n=1 Tax=Halomonas rhizosphaerae TaxID=3043296 RepID=A0ABT6V0L3_9GAMM|nr:Wzy polymerase domain-containing protein [Halomonas rhizosphaerae]MDI5891335.1 Wzy polymerase domain-containing protein [Halomonas rhizosphaerae]
MTTDTAPNRRLIKWFIGTAIFTFTVLLHVTFPNLGGTGLRMPHNAAVWIGFGLMMALAMWPATRGVIRYSKFHIGLGLLLLALWLPFLWTWNEASLIALPRMLTVTAGAILLLGLAQLQLTRRDWWWLGMAILLGALIETALCYAQLYLLEPGNWLGYDVERQQPYGIFQQRNVLASFLVTGLAVSAWLIGEAQRGWERATSLLAPLFMPAILWFAGSVTGWLATLVVLPLLLIHLRGHDRRAFKIWGVALLMGLLFACALWALEALGSPRSLESFSRTSGYRQYVYTHGLKMIAEQPLFGWGYGRFQHDFLHSFADWRAAQPINQPDIVEPYIVENYAHPHNELLLWGIEGGVLPMLAILSFTGWVVWRLWAHGPIGESLLLTALLLPLALHAMTELPFYHSQLNWLTFLLLLGKITSRRWQVREKHNRYTSAIRVSAGLGVPILWIFMTTHLHTLWQVTSHIKTQGQDSSALAKVVNPLGIPHDLQFLVMSQQLAVARALEMEMAVQDYQEWAESEARKVPSPELYIKQLEAKYFNQSKAPELVEKIEHLFSGNRISTQAIERTVNKNEKGRAD